MYWRRTLIGAPPTLPANRLVVARQHAKVTDARRQFHHQLSTQIIRENQTVIVEDLAVAGPARTRLAKSVHDAGWSQFVTMLEYKAVLYGRFFHRIDRWFPSSKRCSQCGTVQQSMPLNVREWTCPCGAVHDRDVNAAKNILAAGRADRLNACGARVRPGPGLAQREKQEASEVPHDAARAESPAFRPGSASMSAVAGPPPGPLPMSPSLWQTDGRMWF
ncbi:RNA-guided endonuclease InsQ/TnpB family protein [Microbispora sp. CA-135349]|uniref:RNA-guided endonuclease InsQ/TnpB family protein n=1 Tax=Microbispora sp. CA-135349 TaxID=3239953 RepID=UPI003D8D9BAD